jgi:hypothetical protein
MSLLQRLLERFKSAPETELSEQWKLECVKCPNDDVAIFELFQRIYDDVNGRSNFVANVVNPIYSKGYINMRYWKIDIAEWGVLYGVGTEEQAEAWRSHKASWEGCIGRKTEINEQDLPEGEEWDQLKDLL